MDQLRRAETYKDKFSVFWHGTAIFIPAQGAAVELGMKHVAKNSSEPSETEQCQPCPMPSQDIQSEMVAKWKPTLGSNY